MQFDGDFFIKKDTKIFPDVLLFEYTEGVGFRTKSFFFMLSIGRPKNFL